MCNFVQQPILGAQITYADNRIVHGAIHQHAHQRTFKGKEIENRCNTVSTNQNNCQIIDWPFHQQPFDKRKCQQYDADGFGGSALYGF
jgi:hypothetical protein